MISVSPELVGRCFVAQRMKLAAYVWAIVRDEAMVEDVLQEVCALALRKHEAIRDADHLVDWMRRAARLEALKQLRQRSKNPLIFSNQTLDLIDGDWCDRDVDPTGPRLSALRHCLTMLTPRARDMLNLRYVEQLKPAQIAQHLGQKAESVYVTMSRIMSQLGQCVRGKLTGGEVKS